MIQVSLNQRVLSWGAEVYVEITDLGLSTIVPEEKRFVPTRAGRTAVKPTRSGSPATDTQPEEWDVDPPFSEDD